MQQFNSPRHRVAQHPNNSLQKAVLSRWLTLAGGAATGIKAAALPSPPPPAFRHLESLAGGWWVFVHLLPISWHRRRASQLTQLAFPDHEAASAPPPTGTRRFPNSIPYERLALLSLDVMD